jgi:hypothetical protein
MARYAIGSNFADMLQYETEVETQIPGSVHIFSKYNM